MNNDNAIERIEKHFELGHGQAGELEKRPCFIEVKLTDSPEGVILNACAKYKQTNGRIKTTLLSTIADSFPDNRDINLFSLLLNRWNYNNLRPCCKHVDYSKVENNIIPIYLVDLKPETKNKIKRIKNYVVSELLKYDRATLTEEQKEILNLSEYVDYEQYKDFPEDLKAYYYCEIVNYEKARFVSWYDNPEGLINRPCPVCGQRYGEKYCFERIPDNVLATIIKWEI